VSNGSTQLEDALRGQYALERELGRGGMATVWLARDLKHDRHVALKVLHPDLAHLLGVERFHREIRLAARLQHPHILSVFDSGASGGHLWFTMPYVEGESLRDRLRRDGRLPPAEAAQVAREAAQALQYAHEHGAVHRDVKPENILLTPDGNTLVADFGIARTFEGESESLTATGLILGTPNYMSPEQAAGEQSIDGRSDVYSLGCVLYEMLAGTPPFEGPTARSVIALHLSRKAPPLPPGSGASDALARAVAVALAKSPDDRFATAGDFAKAIGPLETVGPRRRQRLGVAAATVALLVVALALLIQSRRPPTGGGTLASGLNRKLSQLTFGEGMEEWPAWSPDGTRLAYIAEDDGYRQVHLRNVATGEDKRLTRSMRDEIQPAWSPDGTRLAFVRAEADGGRLEPNDLNGWYQERAEVWTVEVASGRETKVVDDAFGPAYSPDGNSLAFDASWAGPRRLWITDVSGRNPRQVTSDSSEAVAHVGPRWSKDGGRLVFLRIEKTKSDIAIADAGTHAVVRVTDDNLLDLDPAWAPDGRYVYFSSSRGGGLNLWRVAVDANGAPSRPPAQLTTGAGDDVQGAVAPDGKRLAFAVRGFDADLWRLPLAAGTGAATGDAVPVVVTTRSESRGAWSPDGRTIAYNSDRLGEMNLWLHTADGAPDRRITTGAGGDYQPNWSPDASSIAFFSARRGNIDIWTVALPGGELRQLTTDPAMDLNPFYSPDGRTIAFMSDRSGRLEVWLMHGDGGGQRQLTSVGTGGHFVRWTADGTALVFRAESGTQVQIYRVDVADGSLTRLPDIASGAHMSFSPSQSVILDVQSHRSIWTYPVNGEAPRHVFQFEDPDVRIDYPVWSPDGRAVLFDRAAPRGGDLWLLEAE
jgi:Tol biopolymer transport system component